MTSASPARQGALMRALIALTIAGLLAASGFATGQARAQGYPDRPIRAIVPFPAGGVADAVARIVGQRLGDRLGRSLVIENRTGASGTLGAAVVAKSPPDGYTLLITTGDFVTMSGIMPPLSFDPSRELVPITMLAAAPAILIANSGSGMNSVQDIIGAAKARPGGIAYASPGVGTTNQLAMEGLAIAAGLKLLHVPYRGGAPAATAVAAGDVPIGCVTPSSAEGLIQSAKVKVVALMSRQRPSFAPDWPTLAEAGIDIDASLWVGLFAPAGTPAAIVDKLDAEATGVLRSAEVRSALNSVGTDAAPVSQAAFVQQIKAEAARYAVIIQKTGLRPPEP
jgi:tripartite-type tricarboxylate transporter receptor subunit TctC